MILHDLERDSFSAFAGPRREEFDMVMPAAVLGRDQLGHVVILERFFHSPVKTLLSAFTDEEFVRHMVARRECLRAYGAHNSKVQGKRLYKNISIIDLSGIGWAHLTDKRYHARMKAFNSVFSECYPETTCKLVLINAPRVFAALWNLAKRFIHPVTAEKVKVVSSSDARKLFGDLGVTLDDGVELGPNGKLPQPGGPGKAPVWFDLYLQLRADYAASGEMGLLSKGFVPEEDMKALEALAGR